MEQAKFVSHLDMSLGMLCFTSLGDLFTHEICFC